MQMLYFTHAALRPARMISGQTADDGFGNLVNPFADQTWGVTKWVHAMEAFFGELHEEPEVL